MARAARNIVLDGNHQILKRKSLQELSDAELRKYKFRVASPETTPGYDRSRPEDNDVFVAIIHDYDIPHKKNSNKAYAWCAICQKHTHYYGGLALYDNEKVRSVGWLCCANRLDVDLKEGWEKFKKAKVRGDRLDQFETLSALMPEVVREIEDIKDHVSFHVFSRDTPSGFPKATMIVARSTFRGKLGPIRGAESGSAHGRVDLVTGIAV